MSWANKLKTLCSKWFITREEYGRVVDYAIVNNPDIIINIANPDRLPVYLAKSYQSRYIFDKENFTIGIGLFDNEISIETIDGSVILFFLYLTIDTSIYPYNCTLYVSTNDNEEIIQEDSLTIEELLNYDINVTISEPQATTQQ